MILQNTLEASPISDYSSGVPVLNHKRFSILLSAFYGISFLLPVYWVVPGKECLYGYDGFYGAMRSILFLSEDPWLGSMWFSCWVANVFFWLGVWFLYRANFEKSYQFGYVALTLGLFGIPIAVVEEIWPLSAAFWVWIGSFAALAVSGLVARKQSH